MEYYIIYVASTLIIQFTLTVTARIGPQVLLYLRTLNHLVPLLSEYSSLWDSWVQNCLEEMSRSRWPLLFCLLWGQHGANLPGYCLFIASSRSQLSWLLLLSGKWFWWHHLAVVNVFLLNIWMPLFSMVSFHMSWNSPCSCPWSVLPSVGCCIFNNLYHSRVFFWQWNGWISC